ncbi:hypothetical protein GOP47_0003477 [Adiantum capillus-veneris]|uniref:Receptor-like serine/threonine-protein kinase n=1 Tax=Adiantum capillus-veneris TaxID=13818 RepID=A0A9D4VCV8_ADICA|nr:hypothetical protein GOP47_0003477 [Adiantum capillus-veneris]
MHMHLYPLAAVAAAFVVLLPYSLITIHAAGEQRLSLPPLWSFSADLSLPSSSPSSLNSYSQLAHFSLFAPILSSSAFASGSKGFSFGFLSLFQTASSPPSHISLSICLGVQHSSSNGGSPFLVPVWTLNTTTLIQQQGRSVVRLQVDEKNQLSLVDGDGSVVWALSNVDSMEMQSNGNVVIYDSRNGSIWESFEHPSDCLLQGQKLKLGMELTSSNNMYKAVMQAGGIVFYQVSANPLPLVYWIVAVNMTVDGYFDDMVGAFSLDKDAPVNLTASLALDHPSCAVLNNSLAYFLVDGDRYVMQDACANTRIMATNTTAADLLRFDSDGHLRDYYVQQLPNSSYAFTSPVSNYKPCFSPNVCGAYGICSLSSTFGTAVSQSCRCPSEQDNKNLSNAFSLIDISNPSQGCTRKVSLECEQVSSQSLAEIRNVAYMSMLPLFEQMWESNNKSLEECKASCSSDCSCSGLLYHTKSSFCLPFGDTTTLSNVSFLTLPPDEHIAFVKIQLIEAKSTSHSTIVAIAVAVPLFVLIIVAAAIYWKWKKDMDPELKLAEQELLGVLPMLPTRYSYRELTKFTQNFSKHLGSGGFGSVYEGVLPDGRRVAVKNLEMLSQGQKEFLAEIATIGGISHVNIVNLYGFCLEKKHRLLVYEYMENGSLDKWLFCKEGEQRRQVMSWETRYSVALGTARGLAYLHEECPKPILHFDVKPQNILLDGNLDAKLADFGLAKLVARDQSSVMTAVRGTPGYIAPEWVSQSIVSKKCDVYSFGMVALELVSGRKNVELGLMGSEDWYFPKWAAKKTRERKVADLMDKRLGMNLECDHAENEAADAVMEQVHTMVRVALSCIHEEPEMRPSMTMVCGMLEGTIALPKEIPAVASTEIIPASYKVSSSGTIEVVQYSEIQGR